MATVGTAKILIPAGVTKDSVIYIKALLEHPMDTGFFHDSQGAVIPAYFVQSVVVHYGDDEVARFEWTSGISRDPSVTFALKATREAPLTITWSDNKGGVYTQTANIAFASGTS
jgi:sulfur-oxidizing protein SoxZ